MPRSFDLLAFLCCILLGASLSAQSSINTSSEHGLPFINNYSAKDYQAHSQNWAIIKDDRGLMYFGNSTGLLEYDGARWGLLPLPGKNTVRSLSKDREGRILVGSQGDFGYMAPDSIGQLRFVSLRPYVPAEHLDFNDIWSIQVADEGLYFQAREKIFLFTSQKTSPDSNEEQWEVKVWLPQDQFMYSFYWNGTYFVHQRSIGLMRMEEDSLVLVPEGELFTNERVQLMVPLEGEGEATTSYLLVPFYSGPYLFDGNSIKPWSYSAELKAFLQDNFIYKGALLPNGTIALASGTKGMGIIDQQGHLLRIIDRAAGLQDNTVYAIYSDTSATGNLWIGLDKGIAMVETGSPLTQFNEQSGLTSSIISLQRHQGVMFVGTTIGVFRLDPATDIFHKIPAAGDNQVFGLVSFEDMLIAPSEGLFTIKGNKGDKVDLVKPSFGGDYQSSCIMRSRRNPNRLHLGLIDGIGQIRYENGQWIDDGKVPGIYEQIWSIEENEDGSLWLGTASQGILRVRFPADSNPEGAVQVDRFGPDQGLPLGGLKVFDLNGKKYFACKGGIFLFDETRQVFVPDSTFAVVSFGGDHNEYTLQADHQGNVWINFGKESAVAIPQGDGTYKVDKTPFRPLADINVFKVYPEDDGIVWFAADNGLFRFDSRIKKDYTAGYPTFIRKVNYGEDSLLYAGAGPQPFFPAIAFADNTLDFEFAAPSFDQPEKTEYQTWLEGFDHQWSVWSRKTEKEYTNLPEGHYTFHVRARNIYGTVSSEAIYEFRVLPPWYRSWWAILLYILAGAGVVYTLIRWRTGQLRARSEDLERTVEERTRELQQRAREIEQQNLEIRQRAEELATVNEVSRALAAQLQLNDLLNLVGDQLRDLFRANIVYVALLDKKNKMINFPYQYGDVIKPIRMGEGLTSQIIRNGTPLLINHDLDASYNELGIERIGKKAASYLGVPIPSGREIIGVLSIQSTEQENRFTEADQKLLSTIATYVGVAIHNAQLFEEAQEAKAAAEEANEAKSAFLSTVSHELRTPLTSVLGFAKIVKKRLDERIFPVLENADPKLQKTMQQVTDNLSVITAEGERLTQLINDVLDLAKIEAGKIEWHLETINIETVIDRAATATQSLFDAKKLPLEKEIAPDLPTFTGDLNKLIQVVINLLSNAVKFTDEGSVTIRAKQEDESLIVSITDSGIGIAPEDHYKVFEKFRQVGNTLTDKPQGTGLGLPICKEILEYHGGRLWLESELGKGSTFFFSLPISSASQKDFHPIQLESLVQQLKEQLNQSAVKPYGDYNTILIVDDDNPIRSLLRQELNDAGYIVREASNGREALDSVRQERPDLIILDVMMPEMNGFDVAAVLKNDPKTMDIPIIILSIVQDQERGMRIGVDRYLTKPIDTEQLFREVDSLLEQGKSKRKVMVVDENTSTIKTLVEVLEARGYQVVEANGRELMEKALATKPDIIILNSLLDDQQEVVKTLRFEKGLENVLFLVYQ